MRLRAKIDHNQSTIVAQLRQLHVSVKSLASVGQGCPDLLCGFRGQNFLFELKNPAQVKSARRLTEDEQKFHDSWLGQVHTVETIDEILRIIGVTK